ncbi:hypothetical protein M885DRAFT_503656, partial [Pelagophyceae sp. CCMP2097]
MLVSGWVDPPSWSSVAFESGWVPPPKSPFAGIGPAVSNRGSLLFAASINAVRAAKVSGPRRREHTAPREPTAASPASLPRL